MRDGNLVWPQVISRLPKAGCCECCEDGHNLFLVFGPRASFLLSADAARRQMMLLLRVIRPPRNVMSFTMSARKHVNGTLEVPYSNCSHSPKQVLLYITPLPDEWNFESVPRTGRD